MRARIVVTIEPVNHQSLVCWVCRIYSAVNDAKVAQLKKNKTPLIGGNHHSQHGLWMGCRNKPYGTTLGDTGAGLVRTGKFNMTLLNAIAWLLFTALILLFMALLAAASYVLEASSSVLKCPIMMMPLNATDPLSHVEEVLTKYDSLPYTSEGDSTLFVHIQAAALLFLAFSSIKQQTDSGFHRVVMQRSNATEEQWDTMSPVPRAQWFNHCGCCRLVAHLP